MAPDLLACLNCRDELVKKMEARLGHTLADEPSKCSTCGKRAPTRGVSVATGQVLLRGAICAACEAGGDVEQHPVDVPESLQKLGLPPIMFDWPKLSETDDRTDFDEISWHLLARVGRLCEVLIDAVERSPQGRQLTLDQAVVGGLTVRMAKLTRAIFDSTQVDESEAHSPLSRCLGETAITLRWLVWKNDPDSYRRFRADSFARFRRVLEDMDASKAAEDEPSRIMREAVERHIEAELAAAEIGWDDVPKSPNSWGPKLRQRFEDLDQESLYEMLFVLHSSYVHPTWHEIRAFHLATEDGHVRLDNSYAGMAPIAAFVLARLVVEACRDAASTLPNVLDTEAFEDVADRTLDACNDLIVEFGKFAARGGLDPGLNRHQAG